MTPWFSKLREQATERFERQRDIRKAKKEEKLYKATDRLRDKATELDKRRKDIGERVKQRGRVVAEKEDIRKLKAAERRFMASEHPYAVRIYKGAKDVTGAAGTKAEQFVKFTAKEAAGTYKTGKTRVGRTRIRRTTQPRQASGGYAPQYTQISEDLSLTGGIARGELGSSRNIMETNFFGEQEKKDRLSNILGEKKEMPNYFGNPLGNNINKKNKTRYF